MNKADLIGRIAEKTQTSKAAAARVFDAIFDSTSGAIAEAVQAGKQVSIPGFGKFRSRERAARKGRNPQTGTSIEIPASTVVSFAASKSFRDSVNTKSGGGGKTASGSATAKSVSRPAKSAAKSAGPAAKSARTKTAAKNAAGRGTVAKSTAADSAAVKSKPTKSAPAKSPTSRGAAATPTARSTKANGSGGASTGRAVRTSAPAKNASGKK